MNSCAQICVSRVVHVVSNRKLAFKFTKSSSWVFQSGLVFFKTRDDRFILKQMSRFEFQSVRQEMTRLASTFKYVPANRVTSSSCYNFVMVLQIFELACCFCLLRYCIFKENKVPFKYFLIHKIPKKICT
jgi:hypothetical protein